MDVEDATKALDKRGAALVTVSGFVVLLTTWVLFVAEGGVALVILLLAFLMLKKTIREYLVVKRGRAALEERALPGEDDAARTPDSGV